MYVIFQASPNINVADRFAAPADGGGYHGVSVSSSSISSNRGGMETVHRQASTTINDNGNITTYTVRDP